MSMFRNVKERGVGLFSGQGLENGNERGKAPGNRRTRVLNLESLENRQLLSVSPGLSPDDACGLEQFAAQSDWHAESTALVSTLDPAEGTATAIADALPELDAAADDNGVAPVLADDAFAMMSSQQLGSGVLANDVDADGDEMIVTLESNVSHGRLKLESNGLFTYRPDGQFGGVDTFTYTVSDGIHTVGPATVTIEVTAAESHAPEAVEDAYSLSEDTTFTVSRSGGLLANDTDADEDPLYANLVSAPEHGTLTMGRYGSFTYTPDANFNGTDQFTYVASDLDGKSVPTIVTLTVEAVNDAPVSTGDIYSMAEDEVLTIDAAAGVLANDVDVDGDTLTVHLVQEPSHGSVTLAEDGSFQYTPDPDFHGEDSFTYVASDGQADTEVASVTIMVDAVNDAPVAAEDSYQMAENHVLTVDASEGVLANDTDAEGDALCVSLVDEPSHGSVALAEDGSFQYTPEPGFHGEDSFSYVTSDGQSQSSVTMVAIAVEAMNDAPVSVGDAYSMDEDGVLTVGAADGVLVNDSDIDGDTLTASLVDQPSHGSVALAADGSFVYTPEPDFYGEDGFTYVAGDGQIESELATVAITVEAVNDAPVAAEDAYSTSKGKPLTVDSTAGVLANDSDIDGDALSARLVDSPNHGTVVLLEDGSFEYTPESGFHGQDSFTYVSSDGQAESDVTRVSVEVTGAQLSIQLRVTADPFGAEVDTLWTNSTFWVSVYLEDLRDVPAGVIGGAIDLTYDTSAVTPTGEVVYGDAFGMFQQGQVDGEEGLVDETGALTATAMVGAGQAAPFVSWQFTRTGDPATFANGSARFAVDPAEGTSTILPSNFALTGSGTPVDWSDVEMGFANLDLLFADFNGDQRIDHFDLALWVPHSGTSADPISALTAGSVGYNPMFDLNSNRSIDQADLDLLTSAMYTVPPRSESVAKSLGEDTDGIPETVTVPAGLDSRSERDSEESDPILAIDNLFTNEDLWS
jgi:VCBS repeat-containing protein